MKTDIKSILSVLVMIAVAFSSMGAMTAEIGNTVSFDAKVTIDAEQMAALSGTAGTEVPEETRKTMEMAAEILEALTLQGVATKDSAELDLLAGNETVLSFGIKSEEKGATFATSLLSGDVIFVPAEMIEKAQQQTQEQQQSAAQNAQTATGSIDPQELINALQSLDREQIRKDAAEVREKLIQEIEAKKGEIETGEFSVDMMTFTEKTPVNMTYIEFTELALTSVKELVSTDSLKPLFRLTGTDFEAQIDKAIEELKNQPETDYPEYFWLEIYTGEDTCAHYVCDMIGRTEEGGAEPERMHIAFDEPEGQNRTKFVREQGEDKMDILATGYQNGAIDLHATTAGKSGDAEIDVGINEAGDLAMYAWIKGTNPDARIRIHTENEGERTIYSIGLYADLNHMPVFRISGSAGKGGETVSVFEGEDLTVIPAEKLADDEDSIAEQLQIKMLAGVLKSITVLTRNLPEEAASWVNTKIKEAMAPGAATTTAQPETEPAAEGE